MCGIVGFLGGPIAHYDFEGQAIVNRMAQAIKNRGPDEMGFWENSNSQIFFGHRRLSILDLSSAGSQPMESISKRYVIVFNGEIYNHLSIRKSLGDINFNWRGYSDTETLLAGFEFWGIKATVEKCVGMFAFAVWDNFTKVLTLGRDRFGEKPLYYGWQGDGQLSSFIFGSELKALKTHPYFVSDIDRNSLCLYMRYNYIPAPYSIYKGIYKLEPGCLLSISIEKKDPNITRYWSTPDVALAGSLNSFQGTSIDAVDELEQLLMSAVQNQMVADVPIGAFLSGGVDSSTIVALMQLQSKKPIKTFTIGFNEKSFNEAIYAKEVALRIGTDHNELYVTSQQALDLIPLLPKIYCEPFSDSSQIPTFLVSKLASEHVTVSLSGDAGDEIFGGYNRYLLTQNIWKKISFLPNKARNIVANGITRISPNQWNSIFDTAHFLFPKSIRHLNIGDKLHKGASVLASNSIDEVYMSLVSQWNDPASMVIGGIEPLTIQKGNSLSLKGLDHIQRMMVIDSITYLPDDILVKVDRAAMAVSLESRIPFLDHRVVEFAWTLPQNLKIRNGIGKWVLREVLYRHVSKDLIERPKMGFGVPIGEWLRGPLREWAESLLSESRLLSEGFFHPKLIRQKWIEHLSGIRNWQYQLWCVLMFQAWLDENG